MGEKNAADRGVFSLWQRQSDAQDLHRLGQSVYRLLMLARLVQGFAVGAYFLTSVICCADSWGLFASASSIFFMLAA